MSPRIYLRITGIDDLLRKLRGFSNKEITKITGPSVQKAAKPITKNIAALAPKDTGLLKKSIGVRIKKYPRSGVVVAVIGPRVDFAAKAIRERIEGTSKQYRKPANYAHFVEGGTMPHLMNVVSIKGDVRRNVKHPGSSPTRFMERGLASATSAAMADLTEELKRRIEEAFA